jgi:hypothetical protein
MTELETIKFSGIYSLDDSTLMQVSCNRIAGIADYTGSDEEKMNDLIDDHLRYVNNWAGTPDFSFSDTELTEINRLDRYILIYKNEQGNYVRIKEELEELEYIKELLQERDELSLKTARDYCFNSDIEKFNNRIKRTK